MKRLFTLFFSTFMITGCAENTFGTFCNKFQLLEFPIISNSSEYGSNLYYYQLDMKSPFTEQEFSKYIKTSRWGEYQQVTDSLLHIYHYVPVGRVYYKSLVLLFINCGYMPLPEKYGDSDIGAYENLLCVYTKNGKRTDSIIFSGICCITNFDGKFAPDWKGNMPLTATEGSLSCNGDIVIRQYKDNNITPCCIDTFQIDTSSGKIVKINK